MKKLFLFLAVCSLFLIASCGGSSSKDNSADNTDSGETVNDEDTADTTDPAGDTEPAGDTTADTGDSLDGGDSGDTQPEGDTSDSGNDSGDSTDDADSSDSQDDSGDSTPDGDTDTTPAADPCTDNPCKGRANSTEACTADGENYKCGCKEDYAWNTESKSCDLTPCKIDASFAASAYDEYFLFTGNTPLNDANNPNSMASIDLIIFELAGDDYDFEGSSNVSGYAAIIDGNLKLVAQKTLSNTDFLMISSYIPAENLNSAAISANGKMNVDAQRTMAQTLNFLYSGEEAVIKLCYFAVSQFTENDYTTGTGKVQICLGENKNFAVGEGLKIGIDAKLNSDGDYVSEVANAYGSETCSFTCINENAEVKDPATGKCGCIEGYIWDSNTGECIVDTTPCAGNPCKGKANSTEVCTVNGENYECGCKSGYFWNNGNCKKQVNPGNICTGQDKCYNASAELTACPSSASGGSGTGYNFYGQDAQYTNKCTAQSFTVSSDVIVDNNTGLVWEISASEETYTGDKRKNHCNKLNSENYGGKNNWRVPNPLELLTIVDNSKFNPATNSNFTNMPTGQTDYLWTVLKGSNIPEAFNPYVGGIEVKNDGTYKVLCVSGNELVTSTDFTTSSNGDTVTDNKTGLMWQNQNLSVTNKTWQLALEYCQSLNTSHYAGYGDWRLPNKNELASLLAYEKSSSPYSYFPSMPEKYFWSSSTSVHYPVVAWAVDFRNGGNVYENIKSNSDGSVRCVRNK